MAHASHSSATLASIWTASDWGRYPWSTTSSSAWAWRGCSTSTFPPPIGAAPCRTPRRWACCCARSSSSGNRSTASRRPWWLCPRTVRGRRRADGAAGRRPHRPGAGPAVRRRPRGAADRSGGRGGPALRRAASIELHNDSTSIAFCGQYRAATGRTMRGRSAPAIVYGFTKDHRPDLKQLLFILSVAEDGVPVPFRCADGNTGDSVTHIETWNTLRAVAGRPDFLYVADSKLCSYDNMQHIHRAGGRFVTVMPRTRQEDGQFRKWIQTHTPDWQLVWDRPNPRRHDGPRDRWYIFQPPLPSIEVWPIIWVWSTLLTLHQGARRQRQISAAMEAAGGIAPAPDQGPRPACAGPPRSTCASPRSSSTTTSAAISRCGASCARSTASSRPSAGGQGPIPPTARSPGAASTSSGASIRRPSPTTKRATGCTRCSPTTAASPRPDPRGPQGPAHHREALRAGQDRARDRPRLPQERGAHRGPVHALLPRPAGAGPHRARSAPGHEARGLDELPLYPEQRECRRPTTEQMLRLFSLAERHTLRWRRRAVQVFNPELTDLQRQVLPLLGVPPITFQSKN